jgi:hypothetical protein
LEGLLGNVRKLITIGWRATEADFLTMLASKLGTVDLMIVSGDNDGVQETARNLSARLHTSSNTKLIADGFTSFITRRLGSLEAFLRGTASSNGQLDH